MDQVPVQGFFALSAAARGPAVLVLHPWWGLNASLKAFCTRLAGEGFTVLAPDLYHGRLADTIPAAEALSAELDGRSTQVTQEVQAAARFLAGVSASPTAGLAVIGFSLGAYFALGLSAALPDLVRRVVLYYGTGPADFSASRAEYLGHFAGQDPYEPPENITWLEQALHKADRPVTIHRYPGTGHWFCEPDRLDAYDPAAAELAWARTLAFLQPRAGQSSPGNPG